MKSDRIKINPAQPPHKIQLEQFHEHWAKAMNDLNKANIITYLDRELIDEMVGEGKEFREYKDLAKRFGFYPAEISNIRSSVRKYKSDRIKIMLDRLEVLKRNR